MRKTKTMTQELQQKLGALLSAGKFDEVKKLVSGMLEGNLTDEERGAVLAGIALAYMEAQNAAKAVYKDALEEGLETVDDINAAEEKLEERAKIDAVKADLN